MVKGLTRRVMARVRRVVARARAPGRGAKKVDPVNSSDTFNKPDGTQLTHLTIQAPDRLRNDSASTTTMPGSSPEHTTEGVDTAMTESISMQLKGFARGASAAVADPGAIYGVLMIMEIVLEAIACD
ncbi:hypothetical protein MAJ_05583, partial [Metarhizium majus ARSEF 297]